MRENGRAWSEFMAAPRKRKRATPETLWNAATAVWRAARSNRSKWSNGQMVKMAQTVEMVEAARWAEAQEGRRGV